MQENNGRISQNYKELQKKFHIESPAYGTSSHKYGNFILGICKGRGFTSVLDYGCGKATLFAPQTCLGAPEHIQYYDPCIPGRDKEPHPADLVVCTDVMEHIEIACVPKVIEHIKTLTRQLVFFSISLWPAKKILPDGRNAHITLLPARIWKELIETQFSINGFEDFGHTMWFFGKPKKEKHDVIGDTENIHRV